MPSTHPGVMGSLGPYRNDCENTCDKIRRRFPLWFLFRIVFLFFSRLTGPQTQMARGVSPTRNRRHEKVVSQANHIVTPFVILFVFGGLSVDPALEVWSLTLTPTYVFAASLLTQASSSFYSTLTPHRLGSRPRNPPSRDRFVVFVHPLPSS